MKTIGFFFAILIAFTSCEKVDFPYEKIASTTDTLKTVEVRKTLLEDYTGHQCGNCPAAALVAENIYKQYKGKVVVVAVHAGFFTKTNAKYPTSYTTTVGNDWDGASGFNVSAVGNPNGMVNRKNYEGNGLIQKESKWPTTVALAQSDPYILGLVISRSYDPSTRILNATVKAKFKTAYPNGVKLSVVLTEDSIIGPQTDYTKNPDLVANYVFMHVLRETLNGSWGITLKDVPVFAKDSVSLTFPNLSISTKFKDSNLHIVAFAYDAVSREVLQVETIPLK